MANRASLEYKVKCLSKRMGTDYALDYAACYGGYAIESSNGSQRITQRMSAKDLDRWLDGALCVLDIQARVGA